MQYAGSMHILKPFNVHKGLFINDVMHQGGEAGFTKKLFSITGVGAGILYIVIQNEYRFLKKK